MTSRRLQSNAMCNRLATISGTLEKTSAASTRQRIDAWLTENEECHDKLLKMMEAGLITEMVTGKKDSHLPRSCTKLNLVSDQVLSRALEKANPLLNYATLRMAKKKDDKVKDKLRLSALVLPGATAIKGYMSMADWATCWSHRMEITGQRLSNLKIETTGEIDWYAYGCFNFARAARPPAAGAPTQWERLRLEQQNEATHIVHVFSKVAVDIQVFEVGGMLGKLTIEQNWSETDAFLSSGGRTKVSLWADFKENAWFQYERRLEQKFPDSPYLKVFGQVAAQTTKDERRAAQIAAQAATQAVKQAGMSNITEAIVPNKKRRRAE